MTEAMVQILLSFEILYSHNRGNITWAAFLFILWFCLLHIDSSQPDLPHNISDIFSRLLSQIQFKSQYDTLLHLNIIQSSMQHMMPCYYKSWFSCTDFIHHHAFIYTHTYVLVPIWMFISLMMLKNKRNTHTHTHT